jgi:hypothetical protein
MRVTRFAAGLVLLAALALPATVVPAVASASASGREASLPPASRKDLVAIFEKKVEPLGLRVTRAALVNPAQVRDPLGTHLAIYVEPTGAYTTDDYLDGTVKVSKVFLPYVFERWKDLRSFDVCQEPHPDVDPRPEPAPETQVFATRAGAKLVDWKTVDVATMIQESRAESAAAGTKRSLRFSVFVAKHIQITPGYQQVAGTAATTAPASPTVRDYG